MRLVGPNTGLPGPARCSGCFQSKPDQVHVDFEVAWDGPAEHIENVGVVSIDDLVLCTDCVRLAAKQLREHLASEPSKVTQLEQQVADLTQRLADATRLAAEQARLIEKFSRALAPEQPEPKKSEPARRKK